MKKIPLAVLFGGMIVVAFIGAFFINRARIYQAESSKRQAARSIIPEAPSEGQIYNNENVGARLIIPPGYRVRELSPVSMLFEEDIATDSAVPVYAFLNIIDERVPEQLAEGYQFSRILHTRFMQMNVGDMLEVQHTDSIGVYQFERVPDVLLGDKTYRVFQSENPPGFSEDTVEYRFVLEYADRIILIGGYPDEAKDSSFTYENFLNLFSTLTFAY